ncbi:hypothetical protein M408DRAFT_147871 [Serendipita vermifera MAFF 305830]|uniref:Uncharacterized protein n=1 Tax=Serendipita vermifera MAFF 305830 TaxID=933852 RepID=A0A0C3AU41_SERVB|nr:hypothetical protein M408DRAFT_147871 [Serendipita vermifera MAFF 305830]
MQGLQDNLTSSIPALVRTLDFYNVQPDSMDIRGAVLRTLAKLAENPIFHHEIAGTALLSISRAIQKDVGNGGCMGVWASQHIEAAAEIYLSLQRSVLGASF